MTMVQGKSGCDNYVLSYEHFYLQNFPSKMGIKKCFLPQQLECRCGPTAIVRSLKVTWNEGPDQHFKESDLAPETMLRTQRSRPFPKPEKWLIFGFIENWGAHENIFGKLQFYKWLKVTYFM